MNNRAKFKTRTYQAWAAMRSRCNDAARLDYRYYGGRGIRVCERWARFAPFLADMGICPPELTLDRIDSNGHYEPGNCRWASRAVQSRNCRPHAKSSDLPVGVKDDRGRYRARIGVDGRNVDLGAYATPEEAHTHYVAAKAQRDCP